MSKYEWESGTLTVPKAAWAAFRRGMLQAWNDRELALLERAKGFVEMARKAAKGSRHPEWDVQEALSKHIRDDADRHRIFELLWVRAGQRVRAPRKKDLKLKKLAQSTSVSDDDWHAHFDNDTCTVEWYVDENNHAVDRAHDHLWVKLLFRELRRIKATGTLVGNDEYNRDNDYEGGGGNYVTMRIP